MSRSYGEARIVFDHYLENSLKAKARGIRATSDTASNASYDVHDHMSIRTLSLKELFSSSNTKSSLTTLFSEALLEYSKRYSKKYFVSYLSCTKVNAPHSINEVLKEHGHEEADTLIPLHVIDCLRDNTFKEVHVRCSDTDVFVLLMDLASNGHLGAITKLIVQSIVR